MHKKQNHIYPDRRRKPISTRNEPITRMSQLTEYELCQGGWIMLRYTQPFATQTRIYVRVCTCVANNTSVWEVRTQGGEFTAATIAVDLHSNVTHQFHIPLKTQINHGLSLKPAITLWKECTEKRNICDWRLRGMNTRVSIGDTTHSRGRHRSPVESLVCSETKERMKTPMFSSTGVHVRRNRKH